MNLVASPFPPWSKGQCLAPSTDGRGPSQAQDCSTPMRVGGRKEKAPDSSAPSSEEQGATSHDSRRPAAKPYSLTPPSPGSVYSTEIQGSTPLLSIALVEQRHQSLDTRSITSTGTSERAVTLKMPSLAESIVRHRGGGPTRQRGRQSLSAMHWTGHEGLLSAYCKPGATIESFQAAEMKHQPSPRSILFIQYQREAAERLPMCLL